MTLETHQMYPKWKADGNTLQKCMNNATQPGCPVIRATLTLNDLRHNGWTINSSIQHIPKQYQAWLFHAGLPVKEGLESSQAMYRTFSINCPSMSTLWTGRIGSGVMFIELMEKEKKENPPWISDLTKAVYELNFPMDGLKHVFVCDVANDDTITCIQRLRKSNINPHQKFHTWESSSAEFIPLLGTRIGKSIAYFILCAYGQGVKSISRITAIYGTNHDGGVSINMRFDVGDV